MKINMIYLIILFNKLSVILLTNCLYTIDFNIFTGLFWLKHM